MPQNLCDRSILALRESENGPSAGRVSPRRTVDVRGALAAAAIAAAVLLMFSPTIEFPFLNWDDQQIFTRNAALRAPGVIGWAFATTYIQHYQPVAWLTWAAVDRAWALTPAAAHLLNIGLHAICAVLVFILSRRICRSVGVAIVAALLFAVHPLRVEVVAWASAMPYSLALLFALVSTLTFIEAGGRWWMSGLSIALFSISLLARPVALGLPAALFALDWWMNPRRHPRRRVWLIVPFLALAAPAAYLESKARLTATLSDVGVGARLTLATTAPFRYLWRTVAPVHLTPLDPLALAPRADGPLMVAGAAALVVISWVAWRWRRREPGSVVAWLAYLALLVPAMGIVPSGLQATADRYTYLPAVPISMLVASVVAGLAERQPFMRRRLTQAALAAWLAVVALLTYQQTRHWRDSIALWTRAVEIDSQNDVALYNLASALADAGRREEARARYEDVLRIVPDHADARRNRDLLGAAALEDEANRLAASGNLEGAIEQYRAAIALDAARTHSQAALGMALVETGRTAEAVAHLSEAIRMGAPEAAVSNALAFSLAETGRMREACAVLAAARMRFPDDPDVARNLELHARECGR